MTAESRRLLALQLLKKFYGYSSFRPGQYEIIDAVTTGRDAVVLMPTGGGKSLCYQLPALMLEGCVVVVSPLIALMNDQVAALIANGIPAAAIHSNQSETENRTILENAATGKIRLLYVSPERLLADMDAWVRNVRISMFAIDEAHCISQWGHDFRPDYTRLSVVKERFPGIPVMALTATADRLTRDDIVKQLGLVNPLRWTGSFNRPNLSLKVIQSGGKKQKVAVITEMLRKYPNDSGIVYTLSRKGAEELGKTLEMLGFRCAVYHAGLPAEDRAKAQKAFTDGDVQVVCATIAFGMGIDKSNIRWVVHYNLPGNIESYYQEIGRAGRDGLPSETVLFYSYQDVIMRQHFIEESGRPLITAEKLDWMQKFAEAGICRRRMLMSYFGEVMDHDCGNCDVCLDPPSRFDGSVLVQKAGSAIIRTDQKVGILILTDILRGSSRAEIRQKGYDRIKTYGVGRDLSTQEWNAYIGQMIQLGLLEVAYDEQNHLRVTPYGMDAIYGRVKVELTTFSRYENTKKGTGKQEKPAMTMDPVKQLFEQLKQTRRAVAAAASLPAEAVFNDPALLEMATKRPATVEDLLNISGVSERKAVRYGKRFIAAIRKFEGMSASMPQGSTYKETLILHNARVPLGEIADIKGVKVETILSHLAHLIDEDMISDFASYISRRDFETIIRTIDGGVKTEIDKLYNDYSNGLINLAKSIRNYHLRNGR
ncbi:MAG: DNA helicase RecQ [Muribaculaceae bacterium]